jgi:hypothetical protein
VRNHSSPREKDTVKIGLALAQEGFYMKSTVFSKRTEPLIAAFA